MTTPRPPHQDDDFRQLTGAFDRPIAPSPRFAEELKARLEAETAAQKVSTSQARPVSQRTARAASAMPMTRRRWLDVAIAAALIVAMLGGSFWYAAQRIGDDGSVPPVATRYAAQPLSSTPITVAESTHSESDPGNTMAFPAGFNPEADLETVVLQKPPVPMGWAAISGDTLVASGQIEVGASESGLSAIDLATGEVKWTSDAIAMMQFTVTEDSIVGAFRVTAGDDFAMSALSLETGEVIWNGDPLMDQGTGLDIVSPMATFTAFRATVIGDMVYFVDRSGSVVALDIKTGTEQWSVELVERSSNPEWGRGGSIVGDDDAIYVVNGQNVILKLDPGTGEEIDRFPLPDRPANEFLITLHLDQQTLMSVAMTQAFEGSTSFADAISTSDGSVLWSKRLGMAGPGIAMTGDIVAIPRRVSMGEIEAGVDDVPKEGSYVSFLDMQTGEAISLYGPSNRAAQLTSASGDVFCINEGSAITCVDMASESRTLIELEYAPGYESITPLLFWNKSALVRSDDDGVVLLTPKDAQPHQAADPLPGDPGNTNAYAETIDLSQTYSAEAFGGADLGANEMLVVGDDLVYVGGKLMNPENLGIANPALTSRDLATGTFNWSYQEPYGPVWPRQIATDGEHVYALLDSQNAYLPFSSRLIALDGESGDVRWETPHLDEIAGVEPGSNRTTGDPVVVGDTVLIPYGPNILLALDRDSGEVQWTLDAPAPDVAWDAEFEPPTASVAANSETVFRSLPNGDVQRIDIDSGELLLTIPAPDEDGQNTRTTVHLRDDVLVVRRGYAVPEVPEKTRIDVHATDTGKGLWTVTTNMQMGDITVTDDMLVIPGSRGIEPSVLERIIPFLQRSHFNEIDILSFDLETGESLDLFSEENDYTNFPDFSAAGDTVCMAANTVRCVDRAGNEMTVEGYEVEAYVSFVPPVFWEGHIIIGNGMGPLTVAKPNP